MIKRDGDRSSERWLQLDCRANKWIWMLTACPVRKRPTPPAITHWDELIKMSQSAPDIFSFSSLHLIPSPPFLLPVNADNLALLRGLQTLKAEDQGPQFT